MNVDRYLRLIAGCFVLGTLLLGYFFSPYWFFFTGFVALNQLLFVSVGHCGASLILEHIFGVERTVQQ